MKSRFLLTLLAVLVWPLAATAFVPVQYGRSLEVQFEQGRFELSQPEEDKLKKFTEHIGDFQTAGIFVVAHGDGEVGNAALHTEKFLARARANAINAFFAGRSIVSARFRTPSFRY